jgi:PKD repeat protein
VKSSLFVTVFLVSLLSAYFIRFDEAVATSFLSSSYLISENSYPVANFTYSPTDVVVNQPVHFYDHSNDSDGTIVFWEWDFGDGVTSNATKPEDANKTYTYGAVRDYLVSLIVFDDQQNASSVYAVIQVRKIRTSLSLDKPESVSEGVKATLTATLTDESGNAAVGLNVSFRLVDGQSESLIGWGFTDGLGRASVRYLVNRSGIFDVRAVFDGTEVYAGSSSEVQTLEVGYNLIPYAVIASVAILVMSAAYGYFRLRSRKAKAKEEAAEEEEAEPKEEEEEGEG